ncbi:MAG: DMT family transporter [Pseudomonadota bacterium]
MSPRDAGEGEGAALAAGWLWAALFAVGLSWGLTQFFMKPAMASGVHPIGAAFWQASVGAVVAGTALWLGGRRLPLSRHHLAFYAVCGILGTALPAAVSFEAIQHLPVGVQSLVISMVPILTVAMALAFRIERAEARRIGGVVLGFSAIALIVGPDTSLPDPSLAVFVLLPLISASCYALENIVIARFRPAGVDALQIGCGLLWAATAMLTPVVLIGGFELMPARLDWSTLSLAAVTVFNILAYLGFVWLIGHGGPVFASQVGYVVTATGVLSGMVFLGERHGPTLWLAMAMLFAGVALVRPKRA